MSDLIYRQAAIDVLNSVTHEHYITDFDAISTILDLPSAQIERKKGRWIDMDDHVMCSCCGAANYGVDKNFCPNCGEDNR